MNFSPLDNPAWHALISHQRHLAVRSGLAVRYQADVMSGAAIAEETQESFNDLRNIVAFDETIGLLIHSLPEDLRGWKKISDFQLPQLVCEELRSNAEVDAVILGRSDVPEMLELVALAQPGPFLPAQLKRVNILVCARTAV